MKDHKKRIFLIVCYLLVIVAMLSTVSWARYKKDIDAMIIVPSAADFQASLQLSGASTTETLLIEQLMDFRPGETAVDNKAAGRHGVQFTVNNAAITQQGQQREISDKPISYTLQVYGKGNMPLSILLYDKTNQKTYTASVTKNADGYLYTFNDIQNGVVQTEHAFHLQAKDYQETVFVLYLGWFAPGGSEDYDDRKYMKEEERLEIRATVRAESTGMEIPESEPMVEKAPVIKP